MEWLQNRFGGHRHERAHGSPRRRHDVSDDGVHHHPGYVHGRRTSRAERADGGRTGLVSLVTAALFLLSLFFYPLIRMIGGGYVSGSTTLDPVIAPPLILVGTMMLGGLRHIAWDDPTEAIPAFLPMVIMPLAVSITEGVAFGLMAFVLLKLVTGRRREVHPLIFVFAVLFLARYVFLR